MTEDEMVGWHHQLNGHETELTLGVLFLKNLLTNNFAYNKALYR